MRNLVSALVCLIITSFCTVDLTSPAFADDLKVELSNSRDLIRVLVMNASNQSTRVITRLSEGPDFGLWDLYFDVRDLHGHEKDYSMKVNGGPPQDSDWSILWPHHFIGTQISLDWLGEEYDLDEGPYDITAEYRLISNDGRILQHYRSNTLWVTIGDREHRWARLRDSGEVYDVPLPAPKGSAPQNSGEIPKTE